jgi:DNA-directed RNA polymerase subunit RPC12/RpoP
MYTYICKKCKQEQYSSSPTKENEPCIYCGSRVELVGEHDQRNNSCRYVWKVKVIPSCETAFIDACKENNIDFRPYPKPIAATYKVNGLKGEIIDSVGHYITSIEPMPIGTFG